MIRTSPVGISPVVTVTINGSPINYNSLTSVRMDLEENCHDLCHIQMAGVPSRSLTDFGGQSVFVQINLGATFSTSFYGTIERAMPDAATAGGMVNNSLFQEATFSALGCSRSMRGSTSQTWKNHSLEDVARAMCDKYGFSLDIPNDDTVFANLIQSDESDWQFLVRYCRLMGYSVTVNGTHMHIFDPFKAKGRLTSLHRFFTPSQTSASPYPGQITNFTGNFAQRAHDGRYFDSSVTVMQDNGFTYDLRTSDILTLDNVALYQDNMSDTALTYREAERMLLTEYKSDYDLRANVTVLGAPGILPGGLINLDSYGGTFDGLWYVHSVQHNVRSGLFLTAVEMYRNTVDTLVDTSAAPFRTPPTPQFTSGRWTSSRKVVNVY